MRYYDGKVPCPGCGRTGEEITRESKDSLCPECKRLLNKARIHEIEPHEYVLVFVTWYSFRTAKLNRLADDFLRKISTPEAKTIGHKGVMFLGSRDGCTSSDSYYVPRFVAEGLKDLLDGIMEEGLALWRHENAIRDAAREEASAYKQSCYEEGVKYGRQLLAQLNRGEITLEEFNAIPKHY